MRFATVQALADRTAYRATLPCHGQRCLISLRSVVLILNQLTFTNDTALPEEKPPGCAKCRDRLFGGQEGYFDASCVPGLQWRSSEQKSAVPGLRLIVNSRTGAAEPICGSGSVSSALCRRIERDIGK